MNSLSGLYGDSSMIKTEIHPYLNLRTVCLGIVTFHGAAHDSLPGTTQVLLQTMSRGTEQHDELKIARLIDGTGGSLFSTTDKDFAVIGAQVQPKYAVRTLELLFEMISTPTLDETHFEIEKQNLVQLYHQVQSNVIRRMLIFDADKAVFGENHPLGRSQIGTPESINQIALDNLYETHQKLLVSPWGFAVGAISETLQAQIEQKFTTFLSSQSFEPKKTHSFPQKTVPPNNLIASSSKEDGSVYLCVNIISDIKPTTIGLARFSSALLGESMGSRMFAILRDQKAFGYLAGATLKLLDTAVILRCYMETNPERTEEAIDSLVEIISDLAKKPISQEEYNTTRDFILGQLDLSFDDSRGLASRIINRRVHGLSPTTESRYEEIEAVTSKDLHSLWKELLHPKNFSLAIIGDIDLTKIQENWKNQTYNND